MISIGEDKNYIAACDPFKKDCISEIHIHCYSKNSSIAKTEKYLASVEFVNKNTEGKQKFRAKSFKSLIEEIETFIQSL